MFDVPADETLWEQSLEDTASKCGSEQGTWLLRISRLRQMGVFVGPLRNSPVFIISLLRYAAAWVRDRNPLFKVVGIIR